MDQKRDHTIVRILEIEDLTGLYLTDTKEEAWKVLSPTERDALVRQRLIEHISGDTFRFQWTEERS